MSTEFGTNAGLSNLANKQYAIAKQMQQNKAKMPDESTSTGREKGKISSEQVVDMSDPAVDKYVTAMAQQEDVAKNRRKYISPTVENLKERLAKALESRYDNAHNMLSEAFYGFQVNTASSLLGLMGADPADLEAIRKKAYQEAKEKVHAGFDRLASAYAEFEIYAS